MLKRLMGLCAIFMLAGSAGCGDIDPRTTATSAPLTSAAKVPCTELQDHVACKGERPRRFLCPRVNADRPPNCGSAREFNPPEYQTLCCP
jgi:hypothetical protein